MAMIRVGVAVEAPQATAMNCEDVRHGLLALPYTFSLLPDLTIHRIYNGWWFVGRPTVEELRQDLRAMMERCRTDYVYRGPQRNGPG